VPLASVSAVALALLAAYVDWKTWIELNVSVLYGLPLVVSVTTRSRRLLWSMTAALLVVTFTVYALQTPPGRFSGVDPYFVDRLLAAVAMLLIAVLVHSRMAALDTMEAQNRLLEVQNEELERRRLEAEQASRRKTRLLASASHDVRTPVNAITLMADAIRHATGDPSLATRIPAMAERLQANARSLSRLISDLLDVTQFDSGRIDVQESIFSLNELLIEQCANLDLLIRGKSLRIGFNPPNRPIWLRTDRIKLARVITNILGNAIKFTDTGSITVSVCVTHDDVLIHIRDTGVGIALEHLDHIFDEFAQLRTANITHDEGWGLGLSICRRLMRALEGSIEVASEPGKGSVFTIRLPARRLVDPPAPWGAST
jgi:signal transduction histidine kinase